jgi:hypothetical protein
MAITWDGAGGLFTEIGKIVGMSDNLRTHFEAVLTDAFEEIIASRADGQMNSVDGLHGYMEAVIADINDFRKNIGKLVEARILDEEEIINELFLPTKSDLSIVLPRLREQMVADSKTIQRNVVTLGSVTAATGNVGNGPIVATKVLDGWNKPGDFFPADRNYNGIDSELCALAETLTVECTDDSQNGTRSEAGEAFKVYGNPPNPADSTPTPYFGVGTEGSGSSVAGFIVGPNSGSIITVPGFETWDSSSPPVLSSWDVDAGTNGTHIVKETTAADVYRGSCAVKFAADGIATSIQISQSLATTKFKPLRRYLVSIRYKATATIAAGTFNVSFAGTGYTPSGTEKIEIAPGSLATSWTLETFQINMPSVIPSDWELVIKWTGTPTAAKNLWIDDIFVQPMTYFGGVGVAYVPGSTRAMKCDRWSFTVENDRGGAFQSYLGRYLGRQFPSSATPNIDDTLADMVVLQPDGPVGP